MNINIDNIKTLDEHKIYEVLKNIFTSLYKTYDYIFSYEEFYLLVLDEIVLSKNSYLGDTDYSIYIKDRVINVINEKVSSLDTRKQVDIINKYINKNFNKISTFKDSLSSLKKLDYFLDTYNIELNPNMLIELINNNSLFSNTIELLVNKYRKQIMSGNLEYIFEDYRIVLIVETYCMIKGIEINERDEVLETDNNIDTSDSVKMYLTEIGKIPLLSYEEEIELAKKVASGDQLARDKFIESNLRLVVNVAKKNASRGVDFLDLIQEGNVGLTKAVDRYDVSYGCKFSTYATWWIRQSVIRAIEEKGKLVRIPSYMYQKIAEYREVERKLELKFNRAPSVNEIAKEMGISISEANKLYQLQTDTVSLNKFVSEEEDTELGDLLLVDEDDDPIDSIEYQFLKSDVHKLLNGSGLKPREIEIIGLRFGLFGDPPMTLGAIGEKMNMSRERIRQIEAKSIRKLKRSKYISSLATYMDDPDKILENIKNERIANNEYILKTEGTIYEILSDYSYDDIDLVISKLTKEEKELLKLKYGFYLNDPKYGELTKEQRYKFSAILLPKMRRMLKNGAKNNKYKTIYELFDGYSREEVDDVISKLSKKDKKILKYKYGSDLNNPSFEKLNRDLYHEFYGILVPKIRKILEQRNGISTRKIKSIYELLSGYSKKDIDAAIKLLNSKEKELLILRYGKDLNNPVYGKFIDDQRKEFYSVIYKLRKILSSKDDTSRKSKGKTIYQFFDEYSREEIDLVLKDLSVSDSELLRIRYGKDLNNPEFNVLDSHQSKRFYSVIIPSIRKKLKNNRDNIIQDEMSKEDYVKLLDEIKKLNNSEIGCFNDKEKVVIYLKFGYINGKCFSDELIAKFLEIDVCEVMEIKDKFLAISNEEKNKTKNRIK